jgi:hypothetical protein
MENKPSSSSILTDNNNDEQFKVAVGRVLEEFNVITAGRSNLDVKEAIDLREYSRKRTDLETRDEKLTPDQKAWKYLFYRMDEELCKILKKDDKEGLDKLRSQMEEVDLIQINVDKLISMGRQIEEALIYQRSYLNLHFDSDENSYRQAETILAKSMLAEDTPNLKRIETANSILSLNDKYKEIVVTPLFDKQNEAYELLAQFSDIYKNTPFNSMNEDERIKKLETRLNEWFLYTQDLHRARLKAITAIKNLVEADRIVSNSIIKNNGDSKATISSDDLIRKMTDAQELIIQAKTMEDEIINKRSSLSVDLFGEPDSYIKLKPNETPENSEMKSIKVNPLQDKVWFRLVKVLYIVACFLGGLIAIGIMASDFKGAMVIAGIIILILFLIKKGFYYVVLGKTNWK